MKKLLKSKKALSPVVAAIILIAVTVAVSIAVAAWMGSLTFTFMETEELKITSIEFTSTGAPPVNDTITVNVLNTGTTDVTITTAVTVNGYGVTAGTITASVPVGKGDADSFDVTLTGSEEWSEGRTYTVELLSTKGNKFSYTDTAPN
jgi:flagellin-like protein